MVPQMFSSFLAAQFHNVIYMLSGMQYLDKYIFKFHMICVYTGDDDSLIQALCTNIEIFQLLK